MRKSVSWKEIRPEDYSDPCNVEKSIRFPCILTKQKHCIFSATMIL